MDEGSRVYQVPEMNLAAGHGAEIIIQKIANALLGEKLLLRNDIYLKEDWYQKILVNHLEFFSPEEEVADIVEILESLFTLETEENRPAESAAESETFLEFQENLQKPEEELPEPENGFEEPEEELPESENRFEEPEEELPEPDSEMAQEEENSPDHEQQEELHVVLCRKQEERWEEGEKNPRIHLKIRKRPFHIPFEIEIIPYRGKVSQFQEKVFQGVLQKGQEVTYYMFTLEEYISRSFYEIMDNLELIGNLSWYREIYDILIREVIIGKKVSQTFGQLLLECPIPSLKTRLEIINEYEDYGYMQKRWEIQSRREGINSPQWNQVIQLLVKFFTPVLEMVLRDEIFIGDWIPQFGRYLD